MEIDVESRIPSGRQQSPISVASSEEAKKRRQNRRKKRLSKKQIRRH